MRSLMANLGPVVRLFFLERRRALLTGALFAAATALSGIALLGLSGWFITSVAIAGTATATALAFDVFAPSAGIRFLALTRTAARYGERLTTHDATLRVLAGLRERLFRGWSGPGAARSLAFRPARLLFRLTVDIDALDSLYLRVLIPASVAAVSAMGAGLALGWISPALGLSVCAFLLAAGFGIPIAAGKMALRPVRRRTHALEALRARTIDLVAGQTELVMSGMLPARLAAIAEADGRIADADDTLNRIDTAVAAAVSLASTLLLAGTLLVVAALAQTGSIGAPVAALGVLIALGALEPFASLRRGALELGRTALAANRIAPRLGEDASTPPRQHPAAGLAIHIDNATVRRGETSYPILEHVSLDIHAGERIALVGASGAGKSTLLALIAGEIDPTPGQIATLPATLLPQRTELFQDSLRDNLRLADASADDDRLRAVLREAGLGADLAMRSEGLDLRLGEGGAGLSGGQSRRLALARLLLRDTPIWLLDEPTEGLDGETGRDVLDRLAAQLEGRTLVIATHIRREASMADRILVLEKGRIVAASRRGDSTFEATLLRLRPD